MGDKPTRCVCGRKGRRECPALDGIICPACCGSMRGSELACPAECPHFPFGLKAYDLWLRIDAAWGFRASDYVVGHIGKSSLKELMAQEGIDFNADADEETFSSALGVAIHRALFLDPDAEGRTLADRWEAEPGRGLTNDERVLMRCRRHAFPTIIEIQRVLDGQAIECLDLLEPQGKPFVLFDRSTAAKAVRFNRLLAWVCHYPHFARLGPAGLVIPRDMAEAFQEELALLAEDSGAAVKSYLLDHYAECCVLLEQMCTERRRRALESIDVHQCIATYDLAAPRPEVEAILESKPDFEPDDRETDAEDPPGTDYYHWWRRGESRELEEDMPAAFRHDPADEAVGSVGNVKLLPNRLVVETFSRQKFDFAKKMIAKYFGRLVVPRGETVVDLAKQVAERLDSGDEPEKEPEGERRPSGLSRDEEQQVMERFFEDFYRKFLDEPVPALDGMTPREAARDPAMRPRLVELMKGHLYHMERDSRAKGLDLRIDWVIEELGLTELSG